MNLSFKREKVGNYGLVPSDEKYFENNLYLWLQSNILF